MGRGGEGQGWKLASGPFFLIVCEYVLILPGFDAIRPTRVFGTPPLKFEGFKSGITGLFANDEPMVYR